MEASAYLKMPTHYALPLAAFMLDHYGTEWMQWDPAVLRDEMEMEFGQGIDEHVFEKIQTASTILGTNGFQTLLEVFVPVSILLNRDNVITDEFVPASVEDVAWGVTEASLIDPETPTEGYAPDIAAYVGLILSLQGFLAPPPPLNFAIMPEGPIADSAEQSIGPEGDAMSMRLAYDRGEAVREHLRMKAGEMFRELLIVPLTDERGRDGIRKQLQRLAGVTAQSS